MKVDWTRQALSEYGAHDHKLKEKIKKLIANIKETPFTGLGSPEPLKHDLSGWWSRRITKEHRLVYRVEGDTLTILQCMYHYSK